MNLFSPCRFDISPDSLTTLSQKKIIITYTVYILLMKRPHIGVHLPVIIFVLYFCQFIHLLSIAYQFQCQIKRLLNWLCLLTYCPTFIGCMDKWGNKRKTLYLCGLRLLLTLGEQRTRLVTQYLLATPT